MLNNPECQRVRIELQKAAHYKYTLSYPELIEFAELNLNMEKPCDRGTIGKILGAISSAEFKKGQPMISSIVVHSSDSLPGDGFFNLAEDLIGRKFKSCKDKLDFFREQQRATYEFWKSKDPSILIS